MRVSANRITAMAVVALFTMSTGMTMAQNSKAGTGNRVVPKVNVPKKGPNRKAGKQVKSASKARNVCVNGVFKNAKKARLKPKGKFNQVKGKVAQACAKLRNTVEPAYKYAVQMGLFVKGKVRKQTMKTCHNDLKRIAKEKNLVPTVKVVKLRRRVDKLCRTFKYDGYKALRRAVQGGVFKRGPN